MRFGLTHPEYLWALLALAPVLWLHRRGWDPLSPGRRRWVAGFRLAEVALLALALAGLRVERFGREVSLLFLVDGSRSVPPARRDEALAFARTAMAAMKPGDRAGAVVFGATALVESLPEVRPRLDALQSVADPDLTDLASALRLSASLFPEGTRRRIALFTDGNENRGEALDAVRALRAADVAVDVFPIDAPPTREIALSRMDAPARVERGEPVELRVEAVAAEPSSGTLRFYRDGEPISTREVDLTAGRNSFSVVWTENEPGFHTYEAKLDSEADSRKENNVAGAYVQVTGPSRILLVGDDEANARILESPSDSNLTIETATDLPHSTVAMKAWDAIVLNDVPAERFRPDRIEDLERYVRDLGGGLGMIGGENGFAPGGWLGTPVERALPVKMELKSKEQFPSLALVMAIDKSGSMGGDGGRGSKMELANRAAVEAVRLLGRRDLAGVVAFDSAGQWVSRLAPVENPARVRDEIMQLAPGGGTDAFQGVRMAVEALQLVDARLKHVILLGDGQTPPANFPALVEEMRAAKITLSTVSIGTDADERFMRGLAESAGGRYYACRDASRVPRIFVRETILAQRAYINEETQVPTVAADHSILNDPALAAMPPLHGWVVTEPKPRAETVLKIKNDPLLATWEYGLGHSFAFASDTLPRWAADWRAWDGFPVFWDRVLRWSRRSVDSAELHPRMEFDRGKGRVVVEAATADGERINFLNPTARVARPDGTTVEVALRQTAVGRYEGEFEAVRPGAYLAGVTDGAGRTTSVGGMEAFSPEFRDFRANEWLLHELARRTGGKVRPAPAELFRREGPAAASPRDLSTILLGAVVALLLAEVALRRLTFDEDQIAWARGKFAALSPGKWFARAGEAEGVATGLKAATLGARARMGAKALAEEGGAPPAEAASAPRAATEAAPPASATAPKATTPKESAGTEAALSPAASAAMLRERLARRSAPEPKATPNAPVASVASATEPEARPTAAPPPPVAPSGPEPAREPPRPSGPIYGAPSDDETIDTSEAMSSLLDRKRRRKG